MAQDKDFFNKAGETVDKIVGVFNPKAAVQNRLTREIMSKLTGYDNGQRNSIAYNRLSPRSGSPDSDVPIYDLQTMRDNSRDAYKNDPIATGIIKTKKTNVIGSGLRFQSSVDWQTLGITKEEGKALSKLIEREIDMVLSHTDCDAERHLTGYGLMRMWEGACRTDGEVLINLTAAPIRERPATPYELVFQTIEADRLSNEMGQPNTKTLIDGVEKDDFGAARAYWICNGHPGNYLYPDPKQYTWTRIPAFDKFGNRKVIHFYKKDRPGQTRGIPDLAPVLDFLKMIKDAFKVELDAARTAALLAAIFIESDNGQANPFAGFNDTVIPGAPVPNGTSSQPYSIPQSGIMQLAKGEKVTSTTPGRPNEALFRVMSAAHQHLGAGVEMPVEIMTKQFQASFSAAQAATLEYWKTVTVDRNDFIDQILTPIKTAIFYEGVLNGRLDLPGFLQDYTIRQAYMRGTWRGPAKGMINEGAEVKASNDKILGKMSSPQIEAEKYGNDYDKVRDDLDELAADGIELNPQQNQPAPQDTQAIMAMLQDIFDKQEAKS